MSYTLAEAAKATGRAKSTIHSSIKKGRISAQKNDLGEYIIDPAELHRVFPPAVQTNVRQNDDSNNHGRDTNNELLIKIARLETALQAQQELANHLQGELAIAHNNFTAVTTLLGTEKARTEKRSFWGFLKKA